MTATLTEQTKIFFQRKVAEWKKQSVNCAIIGHAGVGKSRFINAIRNLNDSDIGAAPTAQYTYVSTEYKDVQNPLLRYWIFPDIDIERCDQSYLQNNYFKRYDFFLILSCTYFTHHDISLANQIKEAGKQVLFIKTNVDSEIQNERKRRNFNEDIVLTKLRNEILHNFNTTKQQLFLISNNYPRTYEFPLLYVAMIDCVHTAKKQNLTSILYTFFIEILRNKVRILEEGIKPTARKSAAHSLINPIPGLPAAINIMVLAKEIRRYKKELALTNSILIEMLPYIVKDTKSFLKSGIKLYKHLQDTDDETKSLALEEGRRQVCSGIKEIATDGTVDCIKEMFAECAVDAFFEGVGNMIPVFGQIVSAGMAYNRTCKVLSTKLNKMETEAERILLTNIEVIVDSIMRDI